MEGEGGRGRGGGRGGGALALVPEGVEGKRDPGEARRAAEAAEARGVYKLKGKVTRGRAFVRACVCVPNP